MPAPTAHSLGDQNSPPRRIRSHTRPFLSALRGEVFPWGVSDATRDAAGGATVAAYSAPRDDVPCCLPSRIATPSADSSLFAEISLIPSSFYLALLQIAHKIHGDIHVWLSGPPCKSSAHHPRSSPREQKAPCNLLSSHLDQLPCKINGEARMESDI